MNLPLSGGLALTSMNHDDISALVEYLNEPAIARQSLRIPFPYTPFDGESFLKSVEAAAREQGEPIHWAVRSPEGKMIGGLGFLDLVVGQSHRAEIGYWLAKPYWNQGIMTRVVERACRFAFEHWKLAKITAHVFAFNPASARVLEKSGFEKEGYLRRHYQKQGEWIDAIAFGRLREP